MGLLDIRKLNICYPGEAPVVSDVSLSVAPGESVGLVGESGSGKTQTAMAMLGLLPRNAGVTGSIRFGNIELLGAKPAVLNQYRACRIGIVFQDPQAALNPYVRIGDQLRRILLGHRMCKAREAKQRTLDMLQKVGLPDPERQYRSYPHQLSGGMRQRAMIGAALLGEPELLIADEPTTALDVTVQAQILRLLGELRAQSGTAMVLITHDLAVIAGSCERTLVMQDGRLLEAGATQDVFDAPQMEETKKLLDAAARIDAPSAAAPLNETGRQAVMRIDNISVSFRDRRAGGDRRLRAVRPLSLAVRPGETVAIVGESGSGKTSLARSVLGLLPKDSGSLTFLGKEIADLVQARPNDTRRQLQMVFQDPLASLNPAMLVGEIVGEPIRIHEPGKDDTARRQEVQDMLVRVGLDAELHGRYPHELSGGQAQRVAIARALVLRPKVLVCDEAVAALDGTVRRDILDLLQAEQERSALTLLFITHDLAVVRRISHRVLVMYMGRVCELAENDALFSNARHPYTKALISSVPIPDPAVRADYTGVIGEVSSVLQPPSGCVFHPRCPYAVDACKESLPELRKIAGADVACHRAEELET